MAAKKPSWYENLVRAAKADPKKAYVLTALVCVMGFMWLKVIAGGKAGPSRAMAKTNTPNVNTFVPDNLKSHKSNQRAAELQKWAARPISPLSRNLFAVNYDFFPQDGSKTVPVLRAAQGDGFWDQLQKSMTARADQKKEKEVLVENLRLQAAQLKVQSTVMGASPKALVNGELVGEGEVVASFRVVKIEPRRIVVEREGIKLEVRFQ